MRKKVDQDPPLPPRPSKQETDKMQPTSDGRTFLRRLVDLIGAEVTYNSTQVIIHDFGSGRGIADELGPLTTTTWGAIGHLLTVASAPIKSGGLGYTYHQLHAGTRYLFKFGQVGGQWMLMLPAAVPGAADAVLSRLARAAENPVPEEEGSPPRPTNKAAKATTTKEKEMAAKTEVIISGRVGRCVDVASVKGITHEEKARGRGTSLVVTGTKTGLKALAKLCQAAFDDRKGKAPDAYEDRYQAGQAVKIINEALA